MDDKIEVITQPERDSPESPVKQSETLEKLKHLVEEHPKYFDETDNEVARDTTDRTNDHKFSRDFIEKHQKRLEEKQKTDENQDQDQDQDQDQQLEYDEDGFLIPPGKIPIDGNFSTEEIKELVQLSQQNGLLSDEVEVQVVEHDTNFGDRIVIKDHTDEEDKEDEEDSEKGHHDESQDTTSNGQSNKANSTN